MQFTYSNSNNYLAGAKEVNDISTTIYNTARQTGVDVNKQIQAERRGRTTKQAAKYDSEDLVGKTGLNLAAGIKKGDIQRKSKKDVEKIMKPAKRMAGVLALTNTGLAVKKMGQDAAIDAQERAEMKRIRDENAALTAAEFAELKKLREQKDEPSSESSTESSSVSSSDSPTSSTVSSLPVATSSSGGMSEGWAKFSKVIKTGEGTLGDKGYTTMFTGRQFSDLSKHPALRNTGGGYTSDAAGAYQFLSTTYNPAAKALGITDFSRESQERVGKYLAQKRGLDVDKVHTTKESFLKALDKISPEWASMPTIQTGTSYHGQGGLTPDEAWKVYNS
jgi:muramidase (phage lysozyme)